MDPRVDRWVGHLADRMEDRKVGPKVGPKVDRWVSHLADRMEDRKVGPKVDRWVGHLGGRMEDQRVGPKEGRRADRTVGLVALQAAWVEALVLGLWEPPVAPRMRVPGSAE